VGHIEAFDTCSLLSGILIHIRDFVIKCSFLHRDVGLSQLQKLAAFQPLLLELVSAYDHICLLSLCFIDLFNSIKLLRFLLR
jgi:hypothetical protein